MRIPVPTAGRKPYLISSADMRALFLTALLVSALPALSMHAQQQSATPRQLSLAKLAPTPPMGWNSWDSYGLTIDEQQFRANANMLAHQLRPLGYVYAVIDEGWYLKDPQAPDKAKAAQYVRDANGHHVPAINRFPSAANNAGLKPLAD